MPRYPEDRKAAVLGKLLPPHNNRAAPEIAKAEGISEATLYNWLKQARQQGVPVHSAGIKKAEQKIKFHTERVISLYSRSNTGVYVFDFALA